MFTLLVHGPNLFFSSLKAELLINTIYRLLETRNNNIPGDLQELKACRHCELEGTTISHFMDDMNTTTGFSLSC